MGCRRSPFLMTRRARRAGYDIHLSNDDRLNVIM